MASGVAALVELSEFECSVCHEQFSEPKLLPCGHLLCLQCLLNWMKTQDEPRCPLCREIIVSAKDRQSKTLEDLANGLPTDLSMELKLDVDRILGRHHNCCVCEDVLATSMCLDCKDMLCQSCKKAHGKLSYTKDHVVEDLSSLTAEKLAANYSSPCSIHPEEVPKLFCPTHRASICLLCATSKHRSCPELKDLGEKMKESRAVLKQLAATLAEGETELDKAIEELDQHQQDVEKHAESAIAEIEEMCDQLDAMVKEKRQQLKELVINAQAGAQEAVKEGKTCLLHRRTKLTTHRRVAERVRGVKNRDVVTSMSVKLEKRVEDLDCSVTLPEGAKVVSTFRLTQDRAAVSHFKQELGRLGQVKVMPAGVRANRKMAFVFHDKHGTSIMLSNNNQTASKLYDGRNGIVLSRDPLDINTLYEVHIDKWDQGRPVCVGLGSMLLGIAPDPATLTLAAWSGHHLWPAWICPNYTYCSGSQDFRNKIGAFLSSLGENHHVGLALDCDRSVHLYVDGQDRGIAARNMPDPCYAMFDVVDQYQQITALPATRLSI